MMVLIKFTTPKFSLETVRTERTDWKVGGEKTLFVWVAENYL